MLAAWGGNYKIENGKLKMERMARKHKSKNPSAQRGSISSKLGFPSVPLNSS
jgi:hypothetical protein